MGYINGKNCNQKQNIFGIPPKKSSRGLKAAIGIAALFSMAGGSLAGHIEKNAQALPTGNSTNAPGASVSNPAAQSVNYGVATEENPNDKTKTDVYLKDPKTGKKTFYITLPDVFRGHYHNAEYHNGNLYLIRRTGGDEGYKSNPNWTDELWRYDKQKQGQKLYSAQGLDFRVSKNEKMIAVITNEDLVLLDNGGNKIKTFQSGDIITNSKDEPSVNFLEWGSDSIWLANTFRPCLAGVIKISTKTYAVTKYDLAALAAGPEFALNAHKEKIAFSNYPAIFDVDSHQKYARSGAQVNLTVYDLNAKTRQQIATSAAKEFDPRWIDENTLEYNNPSGAGRIKKQIR